MAVKTRERCEGCGIAIGGELEGTLVLYQGHRLCYWCKANWERKEKRVGRIMDFKEYTTGVKPSEIPKKNSLRNEEIRRRNKEIRSRRDKTPDELAKLYQLTSRTIYRILRGKD